MNEMTTAGDIGSSTDSSSSTAPMVRYGDKKVNKRMDILKKQEKRKMKTFRNLVKEMNESPVGKVGRTRNFEALEHIENSDLAKKFRKIVKELGGKTVARQLLAGMNTAGNKIQKTNLTENKNTEDTIEGYIRSMGYKIKSEKAGIRKKEIIFYKKEDAEEAFEDLQSGNFENNYNVGLNKDKKSIYYYAI